MEKTKRKDALKYVVKIGVLSALASVIMLLEFPIPFIPPFYKMDLSESVILIGGFALGPAAALLIEFIKNLIHLMITGTTTAYIGEAANFLIGCVFTFPAALFYKYKKEKKGAVISMLIGTSLLVFVGALMNYFVLIPTYSKFYNLPVDEIVSLGSNVNFLVKNYLTFVTFAVMPFNLIKGIACSLICFLLYKRLSKILHI